jgi:hypothetical protein
MHTPQHQAKQQNEWEGDKYKIVVIENKRKCTQQKLFAM